MDNVILLLITDCEMKLQCVNNDLFLFPQKVRR